MSVLVTDEGFFTAPDPTHGVTLQPTDDPNALRAQLAELLLIRVAFPAFNDGRGFTLARQLRMMGYDGALHACGHVVADQYAMARRVGFDAVEISAALAERQPWPHWHSRAKNWRDHHYQARLRAVLSE